MHEYLPRDQVKRLDGSHHSATMFFSARKIRCRTEIFWGTTISCMASAGLSLSPIGVLGGVGGSARHAESKLVAEFSVHSPQFASPASLAP